MTKTRTKVVTSVRVVFYPIALMPPSRSSDNPAKLKQKLELATDVVFVLAVVGDDADARLVVGRAVGEPARVNRDLGAMPVQIVVQADREFMERIFASMRHD